MIMARISRRVETNHTVCGITVIGASALLESQEGLKLSWPPPSSPRLLQWGRCSRISRRVETFLLQFSLRPPWMLSSRISRRVETRRRRLGLARPRKASLESQEGLKRRVVYGHREEPPVLARISRRVETHGRLPRQRRCRCSWARISRRVETLTLSIYLASCPW